MIWTSSPLLDRKIPAAGKGEMECIWITLRLAHSHSALLPLPLGLSSLWPDPAGGVVQPRQYPSGLHLRRTQRLPLVSQFRSISALQGAVVALLAPCLTLSLALGCITRDDVGQRHAAL